MKNILIVDNSFDPPHGCPDIEAHVRRAAAALGEVTVTAVRAPDSRIPEALSGYDGVILSGSKTRIEETEPWIEKELEAIRALHRLKIPTLGICYGEQMIARAFGAATGPSRTYEYGWVEIDTGVAPSPLFAGLPRVFHSFEYHQDEVRELPAGFELTARSRDCPVQAFHLKDVPMWGIQFHPERALEQGERGIARAQAEGRNVQNQGRGPELYDARVGETIFRNFLTQVWSR